jgi:hypothetical protein
VFNLNRRLARRRDPQSPESPAAWVVQREIVPSELEMRQRVGRFATWQRVMSSWGMGHVNWMVPVFSTNVHGPFIFLVSAARTERPSEVSRQLAGNMMLCGLVSQPAATPRTRQHLAVELCGNTRAVEELLLSDFWPADAAAALAGYEALDATTR